MIFITCKKKIIFAALVLMLLMSTAVFAAGNVNADEKSCDFGRLRTAITELRQFGRERPGKIEELPEEVKVKLEELKDKLESGEITCEQFREEMKEVMSEEGIQFGKRRFGFGKMEELPEEVKVKLDELKDRLENGEITREQFREEMKQFMPEKFQHKEGRKWPGKREKLPEELKAKFEELKDKLESGELTPEQFREEMKQLKQLNL